MIKGELPQRLGRTDEASVAYRQGLELTRDEAERESHGPKVKANARRPGWSATRVSR